VRQLADCGFSYVESASHTAAKFSRLLTVTADLQ
jgi:hypothetical protein